MSWKIENVESAVSGLRRYGGMAHGGTADVRDFDAVGRALTESAQQFGELDVLISGAVGNSLCQAKGMLANGFCVVVDIDLVGTFHVLRQAYSHLRTPGASVINSRRCKNSTARMNAQFFE